MTKEQILALIKKGSVTVTGLLKGEEVTSEHIKEMDKKQFYENYVGHTDVYDLDKDKKEEGKEPEGKTEENPTEPADPKPVAPTDPKPNTPVEPEVPADPEVGNTDANPAQPETPKDPKPVNVPASNEPDPPYEPHVMPKDYVPGENPDKVVVEKPGTDEGESVKPKKPAATGKAKKPATSK